MLVLAVDVDSAANQELRSFDSVVLAGYMEGSGQLGIEQVWLGSSSFDKQHEHLSMTKRGSLVDEGVASLVIEFSLSQLLALSLLELLQISLDPLSIIDFDCYPEFLMS